MVFADPCVLKAKRVGGDDFEEILVIGLSGSSVRPMPVGEESEFQEVRLLITVAIKSVARSDRPVARRAGRGPTNPDRLRLRFARQPVAGARAARVATG